MTDAPAAPVATGVLYTVHQITAGHDMVKQGATEATLLLSPSQKTLTTVEAWRHVLEVRFPVPDVWYLH